MLICKKQGEAHIATPLKLFWIHFHTTMLIFWTELQKFAPSYKNLSFKTSLTYSLMTANQRGSWALPFIVLRRSNVIVTTFCSCCPTSQKLCYLIHLCKRKSTYLCNSLASNKSSNNKNTAKNTDSTTMLRGWYQNMHFMFVIWW